MRVLRTTTKEHCFETILTMKPIENECYSILEFSWVELGTEKHCRDTMSAEQECLNVLKYMYTAKIYYEEIHLKNYRFQFKKKKKKFLNIKKQKQKQTTTAYFVVVLRTSLSVK